MTTKKKIFIFSESIPFPLTHGGAIAQYFFLEGLSQHFEITYCTIVNSQVKKKAIQNLKAAIPSLNIDCFECCLQSRWQATLTDIIKKTTEFFNSTSRLFLNLPESENLDPFLKKNNLHFFDKDVIDFIKTKFEKVKYDFVQLEFFETITLLGILPPDSTKIFVHHEIRHKRISLSDSKSINYKNYIKETIKQIELSLLNSSDMIVVFNEEDANLLRDFHPQVIVSPFGIPDQMIVKENPSTNFERFIFIGSSGHFPNKEGMIWFLDNIYIPLIDLIDFPIYIIGKWDSNTKAKYSNHNKIIFTGFVDEINGYFENSILVTPVLSGSGIRTKILEAFANKIPVLSTKLGSEGLYNESENINHILHFETKDDFFEVYHKITTNPKFLYEIAVNGFLYYSTQFNRIKLLEKRAAIYNQIQKTK